MKKTAALLLALTAFTAVPATVFAQESEDDRIRRIYREEKRRDEAREVATEIACCLAEEAIKASRTSATTNPGLTRFQMQVAQAKTWGELNKLAGRKSGETLTTAYDRKLVALKATPGTR